MLSNLEIIGWKISSDSQVRLGLRPRHILLSCPRNFFHPIISKLDSMLSYYTYMNFKKGTRFYYKFIVKITVFEKDAKPLYLV